MNILGIIDKSPEANESSVEGIFNGALPKIARNAYMVYLSKTTGTRSVQDHRIILPYRYKRANILKQIADLIDLDTIDFVIVRNYFPVLRTILNQRHRYRFRVGFWESFPHNLRRIVEARAEKKHIIRKWIEYQINRIQQKRLLAQCDVYLPITDLHKRLFYPELTIPYHPVPMGIDFSRIPEGNEPAGNDAENGARTFIYSGTIDLLRQWDTIISGFHTCTGAFTLNLYTASRNAQVERIRALADPRIQVHAPVPRAELFQKMLRHDAGIGLVADNELYHTSSPTKTLEYYALKMPAIVNRIPDYLTLFDQKSAFFCDFSVSSIRNAVEDVCRLSKKDIREKGRTGYDIIRRERSYDRITADLVRFLEQQLA